MAVPAANKRVVSGMRPTGPLHLGNYHGALRNWVDLQYQYECFFFVADWHALTTGYEDTAKIEEYVRDVVIDWLAAGLNPGVATLFVKAGDEYVRVATNLKNADGTRAIGTILDPNGPVIGKINKGEAFYGDARVLGKPYVAGYEPIRDAANQVIGIYFVGYAK